ncbi:toll/interleukin-1 receptor domain-containing protein [Aliarcobacter cryaerophilus]|uniref:toll/interleukin-1 receptor domain-containing protein n=1 Tax=Aliarcobacter cryaerophilus TaxID=28198 RepID=UPI003DA3B2F4
MNPKVFISHASEDKERFAMNFASKLRANGVDAWLDKWEMLPGDSLVDKIFEEGIKKADSFIIILSNYSVNKPWIREELNASFIKRIGKNSKIIPIVLDNCTVPECLQSTIWENINNLQNYEENFKRVLNSILGVHDKPILGQAPLYATSKVNKIQDLHKIDTIIFTKACQNVLLKGEKSVNLSDIYNDLKTEEISDEDIFESLEVLDSKGYIKAIKVIGGSIPFFTISTFGFDQFAWANIDNYEEKTNNICIKLINHSLKNNVDIVDMTKYPLALVNHVLDILENKSLINMVKALGGLYIVTNISPEFKRMFR